MSDEVKPERKLGRLKRAVQFHAVQGYAGIVQLLAGGVLASLVIWATGAFHRDVPGPEREIHIPGPTVTVSGPVIVLGQNGEEARATGWHDDPAQVQAVAATLPIKGFADTPAGQAVEVRDHVYLWDAPRKVLGTDIPAANQGGVGSCVAFGAMTAAEYLLVMQILSGQATEFKSVSPEVIYGGSRVQIGKGQIRGDGSTGVWAAKWCSEYGLVPKGKHGTIDLTNYSESRCRDYGNRGCPAELVPIARQSPVRSVAPIRNPDEARKALDSNYTITIASNVGFGPTGGNVRDADGFLRPSGTWAHQMCIIGYQTGRRPGFYIMNSWGPDWVRGPKGAGNPPDGGFWADESAVARILAQGDSWAYSDAAGFPRRKLDWNFIHLPAPRERLTFARRIAPCSSLAF